MQRFAAQTVVIRLMISCLLDGAEAVIEIRNHFGAASSSERHERNLHM
ncbi:hypothetical protein [Saccharopolyspora sp. NPDC049426]